MSIENHPNFHAVKFVTDVTVSFFGSIRGDAQKKARVPTTEIMQLIIALADRAEEIVDESVE